MITQQVEFQKEALTGLLALLEQILEEDCTGDMIYELDRDDWPYGDDNDDIRFAFKQMMIRRIEYRSQNLVRQLRYELL